MTLTYKISRAPGGYFRVALLDEEKHVEVGWRWRVVEEALFTLHIVLPAPYYYEPFFVKVEV